ncbi:MAG: M28 family peptidase [Anaerolineae bacterium]|nr:MAG: M28 family peptidase [Anaerolineae bacterium]
MTAMHEWDKQIIGKTWTSPEVFANVEQLCDFGSRFAWTEGERQARDFIQHKFAAYGLKNVRLATFDYLGWARGEASLRIVNPLQKDLPSAQSLVYSPSTPTGGLRARVVNVGLGTEAEFSAKGGEIEGKFVQVSTDSPPDGRWVHRREKYGRAVGNGAVGFLFVNHLPGLLAPTGSLRPGRVAEIPAVGLSLEDGFAIRRLLRDRAPAELEMRLVNRTGPAQFSHVIGEVPGRRTDEVVVVGAHYDGHDISQGAVDDASGTALVMELARVFAPLAGQLRRTLRFETYAAEELAVLGSTTYVNAMADDELAAVDFMLNLDGGALYSGRGLALQGLEELRPLLAGFVREMGYPMELSNRVGTASDHFPYFLRGVPVASMFARRQPGLGRGFGHTSADTLDKVNEVELRESAMVAARLLLRLANHEGAVGRKRSQDEVKEVLLAHGLEEPLRAQGKWPFD